MSHRFSWKKWPACVVGVLGVMFPPIAGAQQVGQGPANPDEIRLLHQEMEQLQRRIDQLEKHQVVETHTPAQAMQTSGAARENDLPEWLSHFKLGSLIYGVWAAYPKTGW